MYSKVAGTHSVGCLFLLWHVLRGGARRAECFCGFLIKGECLHPFGGRGSLYRGLTHLQKMQPCGPLGGFCSLRAGSSVGIVEAGMAFTGVS
jgi:hypothetical protein